MNKNFRITFSAGPKKNRTKHVDVYAEDAADAFRQAYQMPEAKDRTYTGILVEEIPRGVSIIGIQFECTDTVLKESFSDYICIRAKNEAEAVSYYNKHFKGKRFQFDASKNEENGKCIRGKVLDTYFATCPCYAADATAEAV